MWGAILSALSWFLGKLFGPREPTAADEAAKAATAETKLGVSEMNNAVTDQAASIRVAADTAVMQSVASGNAVDPGVNDKLKQQFPNEFEN